MMNRSVNNGQYQQKQMHSNSESSEDEGFYKPSIQITQPTPALNTQFTSISVQEQFDNAIDIITEDRPVDFAPRLLNSETPYFIPTPGLEQAGSPLLGEFMEPISYNKASVKENKEGRERRFKSLEAKYKSNPEYELVYSKIPENAEFSSYIFSLENTPDYNPNDFTPISPDPLPAQPLFDSRFECGNLLYAYRRRSAEGDCPEFDLILQNDTNTKGFSQWFYFLVRSGAATRVRLNIVNFIKKNLMFLDGVRPIAFSSRLHEKDKSGWAYAGENCSYGKSYVTRQIAGNPPQFKNYYCFSFQISLLQDDETYIALNFPYSYSRMVRHIDLLVKNAPEAISIEKSILCHTISNNPIPYLTIEHKASSNRKTILCMARQHPGETVGSYVLESFLDCLVAKPNLLEQYRFVVVPMVNPDGVIYGNFRTNLAGFDLNRQWTQPNRWLHPQIFFLSKLISSIGEIEFCMDFHGHSKKMNSFIYACTGEKLNDFRLYPYIYSQKCDLFSLKDCTYNISPDKLKTARVNVFNETKKPYIFTLETSFFGHTKENKYQRFTLKDFQTIGRGAVESLQVLMLDKKATAKIEAEVKDKNYLFEQWAMQNKEDDGSESNPSEDELNPIQRKAKVMSDVKARKPVKKALKKNLRMKRKSPKKKKEILQYLLKQKADSAILLEKRRSDKKIPVNLKSNQSSGVIIIEDTKKIRSEARKEISQSYLEPKMKPPPPIMPRPQQIKTMGPKTVKVEQKPKLNTTINSNLFDTANYLKMRQQISIELKRVEDPKLQISCMSMKEDIVSEKSSRFSYTKAQKMKKELEELAPVYSQPKKKSMEKVYVIKENKVVSSITRVNEQEMRRNIEREISNRTMALKNCQKIMSTFSIERANRNSVDSRDIFSEEDPYKTKKLLQPLDIKRHRNFNSFKEEERAGVFFSFLGN